jgi:hypothetical protein
LDKERGEVMVNLRQQGAVLRFLSASALLVATAFASVACEVEESDPEEQNVAETKTLFGDDRVADVLKGKLDKVPRNFQEFEKLFKVGRECKRTDSKEIFVVEEESSRASGTVEETKSLLPRAIVTGCNTGDTSDPNSVSNSFSLMAALFSSPDVPNAKKGDPMVFDRVEVMALDRKTGLYNFYVMTPSAKASDPGTLQRVQLRPDGKVYEITQVPGKKVSTKVNAEGACHNCHVNMGPLMNEMHEPWTNWVSTHKTLPESNLIGETASIVNEAVSVDGSHARSSLANDLEKIMTAAVRVWSEGSPSAAGSGFIQANIDGDQPQKVEGLLKSVFCETELQYASTADVAPVELFVDPGAVQGGSFPPPQAYATDRFPILMPVRSDMDKRIEIALIKKKVLTQNTTIAARLFDDKADVFSKLRCGLYPQVVSGLPTDPAKVDAHVRGVLRAAVTKSIPKGKRQDYAVALLKDGATPDAVKAARTAFLAEAKTAYDADVKKLQTKSGRDELKTRSQKRKDAARAMFNRDANPMPLLEDEVKGT